MDKQKVVSQVSYTKTDQERVQNIGRTLERYIDQTFEVTIKLDGSSCTIFVKDEEDGVCSRNLELKQNEDNAFGALHWSMIFIKDSCMVKILLYREN